MTINTHYYDKKIWKSVVLIALLAIVSIILIVASFNQILMPSNDKPEVWFQRVGSIITVLAVACDLFLYRTPEGFADIGEIHAAKNNSWIIKISRVLVYLLPIVGTILWGYGDLIYLQLE